MELERIERCSFRKNDECGHVSSCKMCPVYKGHPQFGHPYNFSSSQFTAIILFFSPIIRQFSYASIPIIPSSVVVIL